jgi:murein DD-endopeptidase MepM/ murein hydrolase activator NlpD
LTLTVESKTFPQEELEVEPVYVEPPRQVALRLERERRKLDAIYKARSIQPSLTTPFVRPVPGAATSIFGLQRIYNGKPRSPHSGLDLRAATGTLVRASGLGRVVLAEDLYYSGSTVILDHGGGLFTIYAHLSEIFVRTGDNLEMGEPLGYSGATGRVTGPHLHWGAKVGDQPFDPSALLDPVLFR